MAIITVVLRDETTERTGTTKHVYTYTSSVVPRVGEHIEVKGHKTYEVHQIIHQLANGCDTVIVEVKQ